MIDTSKFSIIRWVVRNWKHASARGHPDARAALTKMAWDLIGTEFAGRHQQYEKFYGGASFVVKQNMFRTYRFDQAKALVEQALEGSREDLRSRLK